jgi:3,4-dihydroxy 2-butanone 4-phosphate synthase/GTP cyclohydrolase II
VVDMRHGTRERPTDGIARRMAAGEVIVLTHGNDTSTHGYCELVAGAAVVSAERMAFIVRHTAGFVRVAMRQPDFMRLRIPPMWWNETTGDYSPLMVSVDARTGVTTGISAEDRARTVRLLGDERTQPDDLNRPGHVPTLLVHDTPTLEQFGVAEAAVRICEAAGLRAASALSTLVDQSGELCDVSGGQDFAHHHGLLAVDVADIWAWPTDHAHADRGRRRNH